MTSHIPYLPPLPPIHAYARLQKLELVFKNYTLYTENPKDECDLVLLRENTLEEGGSDELDRLRMSGIVTAIERKRRSIRIEVASPDHAARIWVVLDAHTFPQELYELTEKHLALGDRIIVTLTKVYRDEGRQVTSDAVMLELVAPNLIDWDDPEAFEARCLSEVAQVRSMDHRTAMIGAGCRHFFAGAKPLNLTNGSPYVPVNAPNTRLLNAVRMSWRPAFTVSTIPATEGQTSKQVLDIIMPSTTLCDQENDLEVSPHNLVFFALKKLSDELCGGQTLPAILTGLDGLLRGCEIDLSDIPSPISFYDLFVREADLDFRSYATVKEAVDAAAPLLPQDGRTYASVVEVAMTAARHSVFRSLIPPTLVIHVPAYEYRFAHRYGTGLESETNSAELIINGRLVASFYGIETNPNLIDFDKNVHADYDSAELKAVIYAGLEPMTRLQFHIDSIVSLFEPGIE
jgi:hypothetical protein